MTLNVMRWWMNIRTLFFRVPAWVQVLLIFGLSRLWGTAVFLMTARQQLTNPWTSAHPTYLQFISYWDAGWYRQIAIDGYPADLPVGQNGVVQQNTWAFYPIFPLLASALNHLTGLGYYASASTISVVAGLATALVLYRLFIECLGQTTWGRSLDGETQRSMSLWGVAVFGFLPVSAVLQIPYAESFNLLFLSLTFLYMVRGIWYLAIPNALIACLSRPIGVPLGAAAGLYWLGCAVQQYREKSREDTSGASPTTFIAHSLKETWGQLVAALMMCGFALLWPAIAWYRTGRMDAYTATETAWRGKDLAPVVPWFTQGKYYFGELGYIVVIILVVGYFLLLFSRVVRRVLPPVLVTWCACYFGYLVLFLNPQSSTFRLLLPLFPLVLPLVTLSASKAYRYLLIFSGAMGQLWWVSWLWHWKQVPGGGDFPP